MMTLQVKNSNRIGPLAAYDARGREVPMDDTYRMDDTTERAL
jgi:hypothetical protein